MSSVEFTSHELLSCDWPFRIANNSSEEAGERDGVRDISWGLVGLRNDAISKSFCLNKSV